MPRPPDQATLERLKQIAGPAGWSDESDTLAPHLMEWRSHFHGKTPLLLKPANTVEVAAIVRCAPRPRWASCRRGEHGPGGAQIPHASGHEVLVNLSRMNRVRFVDPINNTLTAEAAACWRRFSKPRLSRTGSSRSAWPPKAVARSAAIFQPCGGIHVLRYGNSRDLVLGWRLSPPGESGTALRGLRKDNSGYDLKQLYIGARHAGIITAAVLKLFPRHRQVETAFVACPPQRPCSIF